MVRTPTLQLLTKHFRLEPSLERTFLLRKSLPDQQLSLEDITLLSIR